MVLYVPLKRTGILFRCNEREHTPLIRVKKRSDVLEGQRGIRMKRQHSTKHALIDVLKHLRNLPSRFLHALVQIVGKRIPLLFEGWLHLQRIAD